MPELTGRVVRPSDPGWDAARKGFAAWAGYDEQIPQAVVFCEDTQDVANAVVWARANHVPLRVRAGRHNYEAYSSLVKGGIIIDISDIDYVRVSADRATATVGAGIDSLEAFEALGALGLTLPLATGPSVGVAGLVLGGGFGLTSRKWGLTCDNLLEVEIVLADGQTVKASAAENADLFWACRGGGGGNFGIVTAFTFQVHPVSHVAVFYVGYSWDVLPAVVDRWQGWQHDVDEGITSALTLLTTREITLWGQYTAADTDLPNVTSLIAPILDPSLRPISVNVQILPHQAATRVVLGVDPMNPQWRVNKHTDTQIFKSSSAFAYDPFPPEALRLLKQNLESVPPPSAPPSQPSMIQLLGGGGAVARPATDATAAFHRKARCVVQYDGYWTAPQDSRKMLAWIEHFRRVMAPYTRGAYVNYVDDAIDKPLEAYYGDNLPRLIEIKGKYDPENVFQFPQSLPLPEASETQEHQ
jgi:FAD/FMN-containing dehydrogenase